MEFFLVFIESRDIDTKKREHVFTINEKK